MPRDDDQSLGDQQTYEGGAQPAASSDRSLGDQSTFGGGTDSSLSDIDGLTGDADLDMEIVDLSRARCTHLRPIPGRRGVSGVQQAHDAGVSRSRDPVLMLGVVLRQTLYTESELAGSSACQCWSQWQLFPGGPLRSKWACVIKTWLAPPSPSRALTVKLPGRLVV